MNKARALLQDFSYFSRHCLSIKTKEGKINPFILNEAQRIIHDKAEDQRKRTGKVRLIIIKGRQQGCSTYVSGRFYWRILTSKGLNAFILSHQTKTTKMLFDMAKRYFELTPEPLKPSKKASNANELIFDELNAQYYVGTAGSGDVGRGSTSQLFHGSEVAFWNNTDEITTGVMQSIYTGDGSEIFLESTTNGMGNYFHKITMQAIAGKGEYEVVFVPWFVTSEYKARVNELELSEEDQEYKEKYGLDSEQMQWRANKIAELGSEWKFKQEYPANLHEAFVTSDNTLIDSELLYKARKVEMLTDKSMPLVMGVDPARRGDRTVIAFRRGRKFTAIHTFDEMDNVVLTAKLKNYIDKHKPAKVFIDVAYGWGAIDNLTYDGYGSIVKGVHFNNEAIEKDIYANIRAEMWCNLRDWFKDEPVSIPDRDDIHADLLSVPDFIEARKIKLVAKDKIKKEYGMSPDIGDAMALTFAEPVRATPLDIKVKSAGRSINRLRKKGA